jgi:hypothetical protein
LSQNRQIVRKLRAFEAGKAMPKYSTIHTALPEAPAFLAFIRMSGETRPWGVAFGTEESGPTLYTVANGRDWSKIQEMLEDFAIELIQYFRVENFTFDPITKENLPLDTPPQIWLPNSSHVDVLHFINYMFWRSRADDPMEDYRSTLARLCGWLFRESKMSGQQLIVDSAACLRDNYVFPVDDVTISHPGAALNWLEVNGGIDSQVVAARIIASDAAGITMSPPVEVQLQTLLKDEVANDFEIRLILNAELERRWSTALETYKALRRDARSVNPGTRTLLGDSLNRFVFSFQGAERKRAEDGFEKPFTPHPETDNHGSAAAAAYFEMQAAESKVLPALIHGDEELLKDALYTGHAISGNVVAVTTVPSGLRSKEIYWTIRVEARDDFRIREGETLAPMGDPGHSVRVDFLEYINETQMDITLHWKNRKTIALGQTLGQTPSDESWMAEKVYFVPMDSSEFDKQAKSKVWTAREGRGSWLTHGQASQSPDGSVLDDVLQIEGEK